MNKAQQFFSEHNVNIDALECAAVEKDNNYTTEETAYIFDDESALVISSFGDVRIVEGYGFSSDNEKL